MNKSIVATSATLFVLSIMFVPNVQAEEKQSDAQSHEEANSVTESTEGNPKSLGEVVITATKTAKVVSEAPATVTVITAKEIENKNAQRVDEALTGAPGVFIRSQGGAQPGNWQNQVTLRGTPGYYRTGVLVDGVPINNAFSGGVNMSLVPVDDIKQIEVVPGPFSSLYGGAGMAGVINIITKAPEKREVSAKVEAGSNNFKSIDLGYRNKMTEVLGISLSAGRKQSDGYVDTYVTKTPTATPTSGTVVTGWQKTATNTGTTTYIVGDKGRTAWEQNRFGAKLFWQTDAVSRLILDVAYLTSKTLDGQGNSYLSNGGSPVTNGILVIDGKQTTTQGQLYATDFLATTNGEDLKRFATSYETQLAGEAKLKANVSYQGNHYWYNTITADSTNVNGAGTLADIPNNMINGDVQIGFPVGHSQYLVAGTSLSNSTLRKRVYALSNWRDINSTGAVSDWADGNSNSLAAYVQDEIALSDSLTAYGGLRYDRVANNGTIYNNSILTSYDTRTSSAFSPKVSMVYKVGDGTVIKGAVGKAFRSANLSDMYSTFGTNTIYKSNPDLKPEKVTTVEISGEHELASRTLLRVTLYQSTFTDLIYSSTTGTVRDKFNAGKAEAKGVDLEARQPIGHGLTTFINATFVNTTITENSVRPTSVGKQIPLQARRLVNIGLDGQYGAWSGSFVGSYIGKMYSTDDNSDTVNNVYGSYDPNFIANAKIAYRLADGVSTSLSINNLFDRQYFQGSSIAIGRTFFVGLGIKY